MKKSNYTLTTYEKIVKDVVDDVLEPYHGLYSIETGESPHGGWEVEIVPKNPKAAKIHMSDIDSNTINVIVDDIYFMEFFVNEDEYKKGLSDFRAHLLATLSGRAKGYHVRGRRDHMKHMRLKTIIEFDIHNKITPWSRNVIFIKRFINRSDVVRQDFESY